MTSHAWRLAARCLQDTGQVLIQDSLGVFLTLAARWEQRVMEGGAAGEVTVLLPFLFLDSQCEKNVKVKASNGTFINSLM